MHTKCHFFMNLLSKKILKLKQICIKVFVFIFDNCALFECKYLLVYQFSLKSAGKQRQYNINIIPVELPPKSSINLQCLFQRDV